MHEVCKLLQISEDERRKVGAREVKGKTDLLQHTPQSLVIVLVKRVKIVSYSATEQNWVLHNYRHTTTSHCSTLHTNNEFSYSLVLLVLYPYSQYLGNNGDVATEVMQTEVPCVYSIYLDLSKWFC